MGYRTKAMEIHIKCNQGIFVNYLLLFKIRVSKGSACLEKRPILFRYGESFVPRCGGSTCLKGTNQEGPINPDIKESFCSFTFQFLFDRNQP